MHAQPPLFIIHKRERLSPDEGVPPSSLPMAALLLAYCVSIQVRPLVAYFIIHNRIYVSPDVYTLISNRLVRIPTAAEPDGQIDIDSSHYLVDIAACTPNLLKCPM